MSRFKKVLLIHKDVLEVIVQADDLITLAVDFDGNFYALTKKGIFEELETINEDEYSK